MTDYDDLCARLENGLPTIIPNQQWSFRKDLDMPKIEAERKEAAAAIRDLLKANTHLSKTNSELEKEREWAWKTAHGATTRGMKAEATVATLQEHIRYKDELHRKDVATLTAQVEAMRGALKPLKLIADAYDANELDDEARKHWGRNNEHTTKTDPAEIELYQGRGGKRLLTLQDALNARAAYRGEKP